MPAITSILIIGVGVTVAAYTARAEKRRRVAELRAIAERRRGSLDTGGVFGTPRVTFSLHDGIELEVSMWSVKNASFTQYRATLPPPGLPACKLVPRDSAGLLTRAFGRDIRIGMPLFDQRFVLSGDDEPLVKRLWLGLGREIALKMDRTQLECDATTLRVVHPFISTSALLERGIDMTLEIARSDPYAQHVLGELPEASLRHGERFLSVELPGPSPITVGPIERGRVVRTCVRTATIGALPDDAETQVTALGATLEQTEHELAIWWPSVEVDAKRLIAAADLLRRLARGPSLGVFR